MYVLTILTMAERDVGGNDSDGRSITPRRDGGRSRRCDREPIIPRTTETIDLDQPIFMLCKTILKSKIAAIKNFGIGIFILQT